MIRIIENRDTNVYADLLDDMYRLRARVFKDRLGWDVKVVEGLERDDFDDLDPVYLVHVDQAGTVDGSCRLLPTTGPTLVSEFFSDTMPDAAQLQAPSIWECTRFCADPDASVEGITTICGEMLTRMGMLGLASGFDTVLGNFDAVMMRLYRIIRAPVEILGHTDRYGSRVYLGAFRIGEKAVADGLRRFPGAANGDAGSVVSRG